MVFRLLWLMLTFSSLSFFALAKIVAYDQYEEAILWCNVVIQYRKK